MIMFVYIKSSDFTKISFTMSQGHFGEHFSGLCHLQNKTVTNVLAAKQNTRIIFLETFRNRKP